MLQLLGSVGPKRLHNNSRLHQSQSILVFKVGGSYHKEIKKPHNPKTAKCEEHQQACSDLTDIESVYSIKPDKQAQY